MTIKLTTEETEFLSALLNQINVGAAQPNAAGVVANVNSILAKLALQEEAKND